MENLVSCAGVWLVIAVNEYTSSKANHSFQFIKYDSDFSYLKMPQNILEY